MLTALSSDNFIDERTCKRKWTNTDRSYLETIVMCTDDLVNDFIGNLVWSKIPSTCLHNKKAIKWFYNILNAKRNLKEDTLLVFCDLRKTIVL